MGVVMLRGHSGAPPRRSDGATVSVFRHDPSQNQEHYFLVFAAGWLPDDEGVWTLTKGATGRHENDRRSAYGSGLIGQPEAERARQRLSDGLSTRFRRPISQVRGDDQPNPIQPEHTDILVPGLNAFAKCPSCTGVNRITHDLFVEAAAWIGPKHK
jgi:hypothetical protein